MWSVCAPWYFAVVSIAVCFLVCSWITALIVYESETGTTVFCGNAFGDIMVLEKGIDGASVSLCPATEPGHVAVAINTSTHALASESMAGPPSSRAKSKFPPGSEFVHVRTHARVHRLTIHKLMFLAESHHLCSLANDCTAKVLDTFKGYFLLCGLRHGAGLIKRCFPQNVSGFG